MELILRSWLACISPLERGLRGVSNYRLGKIVRIILLAVHTITMRRPIIPYNPKLKEKARELRNNSTKSEIILWQYLKGKQVFGFDFHRQKPVDEYIIDFFCSELFLGIELDGYSHTLDSVSKKDRIREKRLNALGVKLIRFWDEDVFYDLDNVLRVVEITILNQKKRFSL